MQVISQMENPQADLTPLNMYNKFIERIRRNLHVVLAFSPIGDAFRSRLRMFPSLINCCTIDWFKVCKEITHFHEVRVSGASVGSLSFVLRRLSYQRNVYAQK